MATKLKGLKIKKVDFVDEGANPDAHIKMIKSKEGGGQIAEGDSEKGTGNILKRLLNFIGKAAGMNQDEIENAMDEIQKGDAMSFGEKFNEAKNRKIADEIWDTCYALQSSLWSILNDEELDSTSVATAMQESLDEFYEVVKESIQKWSNGNSASIAKSNEEVSESDLEMMRVAVERLNTSIEKATGPDENEPENNENKEGEKKEMKIDKSKMTDAERAFYENLEKRYGVEDGGDTEEAVVTPDIPATGPSVTKSAAPVNTETTPATQTNETDNVYKGLHPAVAAEIAALKKFKEDAEERELTEVAKKYEIIGKKTEELVPLFKRLKEAGGTAYNDMIAILDQAVDTVEKSGAFSEIGKSGHGRNEGSAEVKVETIAKKLMEDNPALSYSQAVANAWEEHPELLAEYDEQEGF